MRIRDLDLWTVGMVCALMAIGFFTIYSTTFRSHGWYYVMRQGVAVLIGIGLAVVGIAVPYRKWIAWGPSIYGLSLLLLGITLAVGHPVAGSRSWLSIGPFHLQTAEVAKIGVILLLTRFYGGRPGSIHRFHPTDLGIPLLIVGAPAVLVLLQPDVGTMLTFAVCPVVVWWLLRMPARYWLALMMAVLVAVPMGWSVLKPYQRARVLAFLRSEQYDPKGVGYQVVQSKIALGSGGFWGKGYLRGMHTQLGFVPERHTDFVITSLGEEWGFMGILAVFLLYMGLFSRWLTIAAQHPDPAAQMLIAIVTAFWGFHVVINTGMAIGWAPVTGLPLPLVSYGGSFMLCCLTTVGWIENACVRRQQVLSTLARGW